MHQRKYFTLNFLLMKYFLSKNFRTTVYSENVMYWIKVGIVVEGLSTI